MSLSKALLAQADPAKVKQSQRFFKTGKGEYGENDIFLGIRNPVVRQLAKEYRHLKLKEIETHLAAKYHEERLCALILLVNKYKRANDAAKKAIYQLYLANTKHINNWDLVDGSAYFIVGPYLDNRSRKPLFKLAKSRSLWERRIAIIATLHYIRQEDFATTLELSEILLHDDEDLLHKAVGWMLREVGNRDLAVEKKFLSAHYKNMPRTMLRYAIEKFPKTQRQQYLSGNI